jgi:hypothetical protein
VTPLSLSLSVCSCLTRSSLDLRYDPSAKYTQMLNTDRKGMFLISSHELKLTHVSATSEKKEELFIQSFGIMIRPMSVDISQL